jgi:hypothetical protein
MRTDNKGEPMYIHPILNIDFISKENADKHDLEVKEIEKERFFRLELDPERSKREDDIMYLWCGECKDYFHILLDQDHISRCGALNTMEKHYD